MGRLGALARRAPEANSQTGIHFLTRLPLPRHAPPGGGTAPYRSNPCGRSRSRASSSG